MQNRLLYFARDLLKNILHIKFNKVNGFLEIMMELNICYCLALKAMMSFMI